MSDTWRASLSIRLPPDKRNGAVSDRWARVDLEDHFWLGRCSICNLVFDGDQQISRLHATIQREGDVYRFTDMQSMNGSRVNLLAVKSCLLRPGDRISLGTSEIEFSPTRLNDTVFEHGSSRVSGTATITLRSYPCSIRELDQARGSTSLAPVVKPDASKPDAAKPDAAKPDAAKPDPMMTYTGAESRPGLPEDITRVEQVEPVPGPPPIANAVPPLETFLTIVIDRIVSELKATLGVIHVPAVEGRPAVSLARGWTAGRLGVLEVPPELTARIEKNLPVPIRGADGTYDETAAIMQWKAGALHHRIKQGERFPRHEGQGWEITVPLPRVGRMDTDLKVIRTFDAMAWIHVKLEEISPASSYPRLAEVAGGCSASIVRYLERA